MPNPISVLEVTHIVLFTSVTIMNLASTTIMCLALTFGSGGRFQSIMMGLNGFACLLPAAYWLHRIVFEGDHPFVRRVTLFTILTLLGFANATIVLTRNDQNEGTALIHDFAMLDHPKRVARASIALAILSAFFSFMGFMAAQTSCMSQRPGPSAEGSTWQMGDRSARVQSTNSSSTTLVHRDEEGYEGWSSWMMWSHWIF